MTPLKKQEVPESERHEANGKKLSNAERVSTVENLKEMELPGPIWTHTEKSDMQAKELDMEARLEPNMEWIYSSNRERRRLKLYIVTCCD